MNSSWAAFLHAMLRGGQHDAHHPLLGPYATGTRQLGRRYEARRRQQQPPLRLGAQLVDVALWQGAGIFLPSSVHMYNYITGELHLAAQQNLRYWKVAPSCEVLCSTLSPQFFGLCLETKLAHFTLKAYGKIPNAKTHEFAQTT